jgi:hemolysin III
MSSHIVGAVLGIVALVLCVVFAAQKGNVIGVVSGAIYGFTMIVLYTMSSIYHGLSPKLHAKKVLQVLDHCSIYLLIAGTYTPFALSAIAKVDLATGWWIFGIIWGAAILGITLNSIDIKKFAKFSMACYLVMGWCIFFKADLLPQCLSFTGIVLLIAGGVAYTLGAVLYGIGKKRKWMHSIFHLFVVLGSALHFFCILLYVM